MISLPIYKLQYANAGTKKRIMVYTNTHPYLIKIFQEKVYIYKYKPITGTLKPP